ncbi:MAG: hypothetical protein A3G47_01815 [Candidatus Zambryskibacteria bacterium RIFCSPLOWO2_12_FULL_39_45]|uniref:Uncharacterized protein n=3 Tax=Candidatus Zambryskiibacteriota TaxID=1817925 RepID=A0A1G2T847_9BACT|nr:MAG: hypothetical protein A2W58_02385 [Candidatus Zambryskibacteria bacterium RIFCSPHIGHO2_02_38_10.5]OHA95985.1 MAG: hypothetical protein A3C63_02170 [Candidatus Zambryskibacteria bacterium RIFCSPHIGHO2_02_FULL_39_82]OHA97710.1 MAG: hypothetical protein A3E32_00525 [Candidatus Zambryskibacteria bacterium RIFCSPHIGHO2_12_FULL_38_37]OHB08453.1 MAG: hypothetical protein A2W64_02445 [Candidatus Zambryskibacteria bacterium RIFCSPLOWO2_02_39_10]OHB09923.1 MAG: hypothetical protein A3I21_02610 [Ca
MHTWDGPLEKKGDGQKDKASRYKTTEVLFFSLYIYCTTKILRAQLFFKKAEYGGFLFITIT